MRKLISVIVIMLCLATGLIVSSRPALAKSLTPIKSELTPTPTPTPTPIPTTPPSLTEKTEATLGPLELLLKNQKLGPKLPWNPVKYAIRGAVAVGVPANTIVLLLLLPVVAMVIAASRHLIGLRGFGIFLPAALSVVFVATGPIVGIALFLLIIGISSLIRTIFRTFKFKLQYLPRAALLLWAVSLAVLGVLFLMPLIKWPVLAGVSIFPILVLTLLAEDFTRVQLGKSAKTAISLTTETIILALLSYLVLTLKFVQTFALLNPEILLVSIILIDILLGRYVGLRILEIVRFRKLIKS